MSLEDSKSIPEKLYDATEYILFSGGKRIRPFLMVESFKIFADDMEDIINYALALEMIHTYSLVHDDLPAMDNDDYRRGKLTVHKAFGEDIAILVGDHLLNLAYETMSQDLSKSMTIEDFKNKNRALSEIAYYAGAKGMIGGQVLDMEIEKRNDRVDILDMYELKTAGLFKAATSTGPTIAGADTVSVDNMREFGRLLGLAYQIQDDILDYEEDLEINKVTVATKYGIDKSKELCSEYTDKALSIIRKIDGENKSKLRDLTNLLLDRSY